MVAASGNARNGTTITQADPVVERKIDAAAGSMTVDLATRRLAAQKVSASRKGDADIIRIVGFASAWLIWAVYSHKNIVSRLPRRKHR